jgi:hypothetical protein
VPASKSKAAPGPIKATIEPPIAAPSGKAALRAIERSPFAGCSSSSGTTSRTSPYDAGE